MVFHVQKWHHNDFGLLINTTSDQRWDCDIIQSCYMFWGKTPALFPCGNVIMYVLTDLHDLFIKQHVLQLIHLCWSQEILNCIHTLNILLDLLNGLGGLYRAEGKTVALHPKYDWEHFPSAVLKGSRFWPFNSREIENKMSSIVSLFSVSSSDVFSVIISFLLPSGAVESERIRIKGQWLCLL